MADDVRPTCSRCGRRVGTGFGGRTLMPHKTGKGGPECAGSRTPLAELDAAPAEQPAREEVPGGGA